MKNTSASETTRPPLTEFLENLPQSALDPPAKPARVRVPKKSLWRAIRAKCHDCMNGQRAKIPHCPIVGCSLWPYRLEGK